MCTKLFAGQARACCHVRQAPPSAATLARAIITNIIRFNIKAAIFIFVIHKGVINTWYMVISSLSVSIYSFMIHTYIHTYMHIYTYACSEQAAHREKGESANQQDHGRAEACGRD